MTKLSAERWRLLADAITAKADLATDYPTMLAFDGLAREWRLEADQLDFHASAVAGVDAHIGARIRQRRHEMGLSQDDLSDLCGLPRGEIGRYEAGQTVVHAASIWRLSRGLNRPVAFFFPERTAQ